MRIFIYTLIFFLFSYNAFAISCDGKVEQNWSLNEKPNYIVYKIKSSCEHPLVIYNVTVYTQDKVKIKQENLSKTYKTRTMVRPFGFKTIEFYIGDINQDVIKSASVLIQASSEPYIESKKQNSGFNSILKKLLGKNKLLK